MSARTAAGWLKVRPLRPGGRVALVAPASPFDRTQFDKGVAELARLGLEPVYDESVFERLAFTAGTPSTRARALMQALSDPDIDAVLAVRGGYGSVELLPFLDPDEIRRARTAFVGYSDVTSVHSYLSATVGLVSLHGPMLEGRMAKGPAGYDVATFLRSLSAEPLGELAPECLEVFNAGEADGPLVGGNLTQILASFETPYVFAPPPRHVLFIEDVGERPYRLHRMLTQYRLSGRLAAATAVVFGEMLDCDEPGGAITARDVLREFMTDFPGPVLFGFPAGHTTTSAVMTLPLGVHARVVASGRPRLVIDEAAAE